MSSRRFDALVVGSGPAGSVAATVLARAGAAVALMDKARFPRDKACGDLVGPRGLQVLAELGIDEPPGLEVGDMAVVGPTGRRVRLPCFAGDSYPGRALAVTRTVFDDALRQTALEAGAEAVEGRADQPIDDQGIGGEGAVTGFATAEGHRLLADFVIGADGATSRVAETAGLVDARRVLWGFAVRSYFDEQLDRDPLDHDPPGDGSLDHGRRGQPALLPTITFWERERWQGFPGYGWIFPGPDGAANVGVGIGTLADRQAGSSAVRVLPEYLDHLRSLGLLRGSRSDGAPPRRLGGWLKMGMVGTRPAAGRVLLAGDAAGLVNPLQGEGIAQAMASGRAAAEALLSSPGQAASCYRAALAGSHLPYQRITAAVHGALVPRPWAVAIAGRLLTLPFLGRSLAGGWGIFWNELLDGAAPGPARAIAGAATAVGRAVTARSEVSRWFAECFPA